ncbi:MAG: AAA family ATPase [Burkholderiaceae bacterium]
MEEVEGRAAAAIAIAGEAGIGKSRLCHEFLAGDAAGEVRVVAAHAVAHQRSALGIARELARACLEGMSGGAGIESAEDVERALDGHCFDRMQRAGLRVLLDFDPAEPDWHHLDPIECRFHIFDALEALLAASASAVPQVILIEDLHWADAESVAFVEGLCQRGGLAGTLLLLTYRPEFHPNWAETSIVSLLRIDALDTDEARVMVDGLIGGHASLQEVRAAVISRAEGNPFYIEESIRSLHDEGVVVSDETGCRPGARDLSQWHVAPTIEAVVAARIDRLPEELKELLRTAAVIGNEASVVDLASMLVCDAVSTRTRIDALVDADMMRWHPGDSGTARFRHATIREVIYQGLTRSERVKLHADVVSMYERIHPDRLVALVDRLVDHAALGGRWEDTVRYAKLAVKRASERSANREAIHATDQGLAALAQLLPTPPWREAELELRLSAMVSRLPLGLASEILPILRRAEAIALEARDPVRFGAVQAQLAAVLWFDARYDQAEVAADQALEIFGKSGNPVYEGTALHAQAIVYHARGEYARTVETSRRVWALFDGEARYRRFGWVGYPVVFSGTYLGSALAGLGALEDGERVLRESVAVARRVNHPYSIVFALQELGCVLVMQDRPTEAAEVLSECLEIARRWQILNMYAPVSGRLAHALADAGDSAAGVRAGMGAFERREERYCARYGLHYLQHGLGHAHLRAGDGEQALALAVVMAASTAECGEDGHRAWALDLKAQAAALIGKPTEARAALSDALALAQKCGMRRLAADCEARLARAFN